jgi:hypothetical protein
LPQELQEAYPYREIEQMTIVVALTGIFQKRSHLPFAKTTRLEGKNLARWRLNSVDMTLQGLYNVYTVSMERAKFGREYPPDKETLAILDAHEVDLMSGEGEEPAGFELSEDEEIT